MTYNILLIINQKYFDLSKICLHSILKNTNIDNINTIFIADIGLNDSSRIYFKKLSDKIQIIDTDLNVSYSKDCHTEEWVEAVCAKTQVLFNLIQSSDNLPIIMMDTDMFVIKDFSHVIDKSKTIQICKRRIPAIRPDMTMDYIGSFLIVNDLQASDFIKSWIKRIKERIEAKTIPAYETPALCETIEKFRNKITIGDLNEDDISCNNSFINGLTSIIHMKSEGAPESENLAFGRVKAVANYPHDEILKYLNYNFITTNEYLKYKPTRQAKVVIYTAISGGYDDLIQHKYISKDFDYVCYTDTLVNDPGIWEIRPLEDRGYDGNRNAKYYKIFPHEFFPEYEYSIWIDGNIDVLNDELEKRVYELIDHEKLISANIHFERSCIYQEGNICMAYSIDDPGVIKRQMDYLTSKGFPENYGLFEMNLFFRVHNSPVIINLMNDWWEMIAGFSKRDQLSFMYALWKNGLECEQMYEQSHRYRPGFSFKPHHKKVYSLLYIDSGNGFDGNEFIVEPVILKANQYFKITFDLSSYPKIESLRFDPLEGQFCVLKLNKIIVKYTNNEKTLTSDEIKKIITTNGMLNELGEIFFYTTDPQVVLPLSGEIMSISIEGELRILGLDEIIHEKEQIIHQKDQVIVAINSSWAMRIGKSITWLPRKVLNLARRIF